MVMGLLQRNFQFIRELSTWREKSEDRATASPRDSFFLLFTRIIRHKTLEIYTIVEAESWMLGFQGSSCIAMVFKTS